MEMDTHPQQRQQPQQEQPQSVTPQVLIERIAFFLGNNRHQHVQQCQEKLSEMTARIGEQWGTYHADQAELAKLQRESDDIRSQIHILQHQLCEKLLQQKGKALSSEHTLKNVNEMLGQTRVLAEHLRIAKNELSASATGLHTDIARMNGYVAPLAEQLGKVTENPSETNLRNESEVVVKRERGEEDDGACGEETTSNRSYNPPVDSRKKQRTVEGCHYFNTFGGCRHTSTMCRRVHRCSNCWSRNHSAMQCDMEIDDRRRRL